MRRFAICCLTVLIPAVASAAPFLEGSVTDEQGRPIAGATVRIWDCVGTCLGGDTRLTDEQGHYVFQEKSFRNFPSLSVSMPGRYHVSTKQSGPALHEPDTDEPRRADFVLGTPAAVTLEIDGKVPDGWTQKAVLRAGREVTLHRYDETGQFTSGWETWNFAIVPREEPFHVVLIREPIPEPTDDKKLMRERERESSRQRVEIVSPAITLPDPQRYRINVVVDGDENQQTLSVAAIYDVLGKERGNELVQADPLYGPAVDEETRAAALALLGRVKQAARPWNARPDKSVVSYEYDVVDPKTTTHVSITQDSPSGPAWSDISRLRGFAYMPPLRWLFNQPENVVFHRVEIGEERAELVYRLKSRRGFGAGLGVGPTWFGFFTRSFSAGRITIDPKTATVVEHRFSNGPLGEESIETFSNYVGLGDGYAPRTLRIQSGNFDFHLNFRVHEKELWLLDTATRDDSDEPVIQVKDVSVVQQAE